MQDNKKIFIVIILIISISILFYIKLNIEKQKLNIEETIINEEKKQKSNNDYIELIKKIRGENYISENIIEYTENDVLNIDLSPQIQGFYTPTNKLREEINIEELEGKYEKYMLEFGITNIKKVKSEFMVDISEINEDQYVDYIIQYSGVKNIDGKENNILITTRNVTNNNKKITNLSSYANIKIEK